MFRRKLLAWFRESRRDLPWRGTKDPYRIWLSEIMLQQTRVAAAIPYYERFLRCLPDIASLAAAPPEDVLRHWAGLGYYSRARNLQAAARQIVKVHGGIFPPTAEETLALPGIGRYTAAAILSIAFGEQLAVLDGNVARVIARLDAIRGDLRSPTRWRALQKRADELLAIETPGDFNQAMMELGAMICTPRAPKCLLCPVAEFCKARKLGLADVIPHRRQKRAAVDVKLAVAVLADSKMRTLLLSPAKQSGGDADLANLFSRMWQFPAVRLGGADAVEAVADSFRAWLGTIGGGKLEPLGQVRHTVTFRKITAEPFLIRCAKLPRRAGARMENLERLAAASPHARPISNLTRKIAQAALVAANAVSASATSRARKLK
jgi:A/G-specific adenine glycosylase